MATLYRPAEVTKENSIIINRFKGEPVDWNARLNEKQKPSKLSPEEQIEEQINSFTKKKMVETAVFLHNQRSKWDESKMIELVVRSGNEGGYELEIITVSSQKHLYGCNGFTEDGCYTMILMSLLSEYLSNRLKEVNERASN